MFESMTDEELTAVISDLGAAIRNLAKGGDVQVIWAEGRRIEYTNGNIGECKKLLSDARYEQSRRNGTGCEGRAIGVRFY